MKYLVVIEETETGFSAYSPDLPGCISTGNTCQEVEENMREALVCPCEARIAFHFDGLKRDGLEIPRPSTTSAYIEVAA